MRLERYITEANIKVVTGEEEKAKDLIQKDCRYYLKLIGNLKPFKRLGVSTTTDGDMLLSNTVRQNRKPSGTFEDDFKKVNKWLKANGHVTRDKGLMARSNSDFGLTDQFYIWPIGKFNYTWIKAYDFNVEDDNTGWPGVGFGKTERSPADEVMDKYITSNKGVRTAHKGKYEIWFDCKRFYFCPEEGEMAEVLVG